MTTFYTKRKKIISLIIITCMLFGLTACGKGKGGMNTGTDADYGDKRNSVFESDNDFEIKFEDDFRPEKIETSKDKIFFVASRYNESTETDATNSDASMGDASEYSVDYYDGDYNESVGETEYKLLCTNLDGSNIKELEIPEFKGEIYFDNMYVSSSGRMALSVSESVSEGEEYSHFTYIVFYDEDQKLINKADMTKVYEYNDEEYVLRTLFDNDGNLILFTESHIYMYDSNGKEINKANFEGIISQAAFTGDGQIVIKKDDYESEKISLNIVDAKTGSLGEPFDLDVEYFQSSECLLNGDETADFYYCDEKGIYAYDIEAKEATKIIDYNASDIVDGLISKFCLPNRDTLIVLQNKADYSGIEILKYVKVDPDKVKDKKSITLMTYNASEGLKATASAFNKKNNEYRIDIVDYSGEDDPEAAMSTDIASGKIPDIYDISMGIGKMSISQAVEKGLLENLAPYMEKDPEISADDILPNIIEAGKIGDGIYTISSNFSIVSLGAKGSDIGNLDGWTFSEMKKYVDSKDDDVVLLEYTDKESLLDIFLTADIEEFVDWQTGECHFDTDDFKALLEICNRGSKEINYDEEVSYIKLIQEGKQLFKQLYITGYDIEVDSKIFKNDIAYVGFPTEDRAGTFVQFSSSYGISSESENKDACWQFLREFISYEYQSEAVSKEIIYDIPTRKDVFEEYLRKLTTTEEYKDAYGNTVSPMDYEMGIGDITVDVKPFNEKEEKQFRDIVSKARKTVYYNSSLTAIVKEEAARYFSGDKTVDETAELIQNRMTIYINESR